MTTSGGAAETLNRIKEVSEPELPLMPILLGWTVENNAWQTLVNLGSRSIAYRQGNQCCKCNSNVVG